MIMSIRRGTIRLALASVAWVLLAALSTACRADTVASLLGNFTINQYAGLRIADGAVGVRYTVVLGQLPALRELHLADADGDGVTSQEERDAYARTLAPGFADRLLLRVDGAAVPLRATRWTSSLPTEQGGFSLRVDVDFAGTLPSSRGADVRHLEFDNQNYAGRFGWQEVVVEPARGVSVFDTNAFSTSLTAGLTQAVQTMPAAGPPAERAVHLAYRLGGAPAGSTPLQARPGTPAASVASGVSQLAASSSWLARQTRRVVDLISAPAVPLHVAMFALLAAVVLGALHAFSPGHGKTVVGAYLIGSRGTPRHALFLGFTVTITHTIGVFLLGFAMLVASRFFVPERLFPILSLLSGLLVMGMGLVLFGRRWRGALAALKGSARPVYRALDAATAKAAAPSWWWTRAPLRGGGFGVLAFAHGDSHGTHAHAHEHVHARMLDRLALAHGHGRDGGLHSHGGRAHSHLPPAAMGEGVTWRSLLALGISGGLVPCPSALVLLLAAVALNKTAYGLLLVLAFSAGLAATLTAVGVAFLYARDRFAGRATGARWPRLLSAASAGAITLVGALMCYAAIVAYAP